MDGSRASSAYKPGTRKQAHGRRRLMRAAKHAGKPFGQRSKCARSQLVHRLDEREPRRGAHRSDCLVRDQLSDVRLLWRH
jgi:hypothetical protein